MARTPPPALADISIRLLISIAYNPTQVLYCTVGLGYTRLHMLCRRADVQYGRRIAVSYDPGMLKACLSATSIRDANLNVSKSANLAVDSGKMLF